MLFVSPAFAKKFKCLAYACTDSCCVGWEIGIDDATLGSFDSLDGELGKRLREHVERREDGAVFRLECDGRCPFLDARGLCDIIKEKGECSIPEICREHPRYYNVLGDRVEWGLGLSCEEAARLILECRDIREACESEHEHEGTELDGELTSFITFLRDESLKLLYESKLCLFERLAALLYYAEGCDCAIEERAFGAFYPAFPLTIREKLDTGMGLHGFSGIFTLFSEMDFMNEKFGKRLTDMAKDCGGIPMPDGNSESLIIRLVAYFIHRYFITAAFDEQVTPKVKFAIISALVIYALIGNGKDLTEWINAAKAYSKEMEYNEDNRDLFFEMCYTEKELSTSSITIILTD